MKDSAFVGEVDCFSDGLEAGGRLFGGKRFLLDQSAQIGPVDQVHDQIRLVLVQADLMDGDDVRVLEGGGG